MPLPSLTDLAYIAGIVDGEGSISLIRSHAKRTRGRYVYPLVKIANTSEALILWLEANVPYRAARQYVSRMNERCKDVYHLGWAANEAVHLLTAVYPYLVIKRTHAEIVLDLWERNRIAAESAGGKFGHGRPLPDEIVTARTQAFELLRRLNHRGAPICP